MPRAFRRITFEGPTLLVPRVRMLGFASIRAATDLPLLPHVHEDAYEICLSRRGSIEWWVGDELHASGPDEVYVTRPGELHGSVDAVIHPADLWWVQVAAVTGDPLVEALGSLRQRVFPVSSAVTGAFERLLGEHARPDAYAPAAADAALDTLLVSLLRDHAAARERRPSPAIAAALAWAAARLGEAFAIADWAHAAGLSVTRFHARFQRELGQSPGQWRTRQRIERAKWLLHDPTLSVTDVALRSGFSTSQYFATAFKRLVGVSPSEYRPYSTRHPADVVRSATGAMGT